MHCLRPLSLPDQASRSTPLPTTRLGSRHHPKKKTLYIELGKQGGNYFQGCVGRCKRPTPGPKLFSGFLNLYFQLSETKLWTYVWSGWVWIWIGGEVLADSTTKYWHQYFGGVKVDQSEPWISAKVNFRSLEKTSVCVLSDHMDLWSVILQAMNLAGVKVNSLGLMDLKHLC